MTYHLGALTCEDCEVARQWRNADDVRMGLRTPFMLPEEMQADFYRDVVCNRESRHRYWAVRNGNLLVAMVGLTDIEWENGLAEISLLVSPDVSKQGAGSAAVHLALREAFERMRLLTVVGLCYSHNPAAGFWAQQLRRWPGTGSTTLPRRKFWDGRLHDALYFYFTAEGFAAPERHAA